MKKAAVLIARGVEEAEALTIVDILRRAHISCDLIGLEKRICGAHNISMSCDGVFGEELIDYDMIILPGGYGCAEGLRERKDVIALLQKMDNAGKWICAMCASPIVLERAGLLDGRKYTAYMGYDQKISAGQYLEDIVVVDGNIVTGRGPATVYAFAYRLVELLGGDSMAVKQRMVYFNAFDAKEVE